MVISLKKHTSNWIQWYLCVHVLLCLINSVLTPGTHFIQYLKMDFTEFPIIHGLAAVIKIFQVFIDPSRLKSFIHDLYFSVVKETPNSKNGLENSIMDNCKKQKNLQRVLTYPSRKTYLHTLINFGLLYSLRMWNSLRNSNLLSV